MNVLSISESNLINSILKNPDKDFQKIVGLIEKKKKQLVDKYKSIYENSIEGVCIVDPLADMTFINQRMTEISGYSNEEMIGKSIFSLIDQEEARNFKNRLESRKRGISEKYEVKLSRKNGEEIYVKIKATPQYDESGNYDGSVAFIEDVSEKRKVEQLLRESEEKFRTLIEGLTQTKIGVDIVDLNHNVIYQNDVLKSRFGEHHGRKCYEHYLGRKNSCKNCPMEKAINTNRVEKLTIPTPENRIYEITSAPLPSKEGKVDRAAEVIIDVTERVQIEQKLKDSEEQFRTMADQSLAAIGIFQNNEIKYVNEAYSLITGIPLNEIYSMTVDDFVDKAFIVEDREWIKEYSKVTQSGERITPEIVEGRLINMDNEVRWVLYSSKSIIFQGKPAAMHLAIDITERRQAEEKLRESEEKYRNLVETSSMALLEIDFSTKELVYINPKLLDIIGYTYEELLKEMAFQKYIHPEDLKNLDLSEKERKLEFRVVAKDGKIKWLSGDKLHFYDENGNLTYVRLWLQDITEKKELEQIKTNLLIRFSHEFKTPLISIKGFSDLILEEYRDNVNETIVSFLEKIKEGANTLNSLTNRFIESTKLGENLVRVNIKRVNIAKLINRVLIELEGVIKSRQHKIDLKLEKDLLINYDPEKFYTIISNLLLNASKFTPQGGLITISTTTENGFVIISIKDNGIGLNKEELENLFKPFGKIERYGQGLDIVPDGMGMGLFITKELVGLHKGTIWAESAGRNKGSIFSVKIPLNLQD